MCIFTTTEQQYIFFLFSRSQTQCFQNICTENYTNTRLWAPLLSLFIIILFDSIKRGKEISIFIWCHRLFLFHLGLSFVWALTRYRRRHRLCEFTFWQMPPLLSLIWYNRKARIPAAVRKRQKSNSFTFASYTQLYYNAHLIQNTNDVIVITTGITTARISYFCFFRFFLFLASHPRMYSVSSETLNKKENEYKRMPRIAQSGKHIDKVQI